MEMFVVEMMEGRSSSRFKMDTRVCTGTGERWGGGQAPEFCGLPSPTSTSRLPDITRSRDTRVLCTAAPALCRFCFCFMAFAPSMPESERLCVRRGAGAASESLGDLKRLSDDLLRRWCAALFSALPTFPRDCDSASWAPTCDGPAPRFFELCLRSRRVPACTAGFDGGVEATAEKLNLPPPALSMGGAGARPGEKSLLRRGSASRAAGGRAPAPEASNMLLNLGMGLGGRMHLDSLNFGRAHGTPISTSPSSAPRFPGGSVAGASGAAPS